MHVRLRIGWSGGRMAVVSGVGRDARRDASRDETDRTRRV